VTSAPSGSVRQPVWSRPEPLGLATSGSTFGSVAAPLLAGFSLTAVVELVGKDDGGLRGDGALIAFAAAAGLLVYTIQLSVTAARHQVSPADRLAWIPEARLDDDWLNWLRDNQWRDEALAERQRARARVSYNGGILAFLAGLVLVLVPGPGDWRLARVLALAAAGTVLLAELVLLAEHPRLVRSALSPTIDDLEEGWLWSSPVTTPPVDAVLLRRLVVGEAAQPDPAELDRVLAALRQRQGADGAHPVEMNP
jgi:hypothetical protein